MKTTESLAGTSLGRVLLHVICLLRQPDRYAWHCRGILREFAPGFLKVSSWHAARFCVPIRISTGGLRQPDPRICEPREARSSVTFSQQH